MILKVWTTLKGVYGNCDVWDSDENYLFCTTGQEIEISKYVDKRKKIIIRYPKHNVSMYSIEYEIEED